MKSHILLLYLSLTSKKREEGTSMNQMELLIESKLVWSIIGVCLIDVIVKFMLRHTYHRLLRAAEDMGRSKHRLMKTLRMKFDACYQLNIGVPNVSLFVEKYLRHYRVLGIPMKSWENITNICIVLVMSASVGSGLWAMMQQADESVFFSLLVGVVGTGFLLLVDVIGNAESRFELLRVDITDYLENICKPRLENDTFHPVEVKENREECFEESDNVVKLNAKKAEEQIASSIQFTEEEEEVIREVIQEYLG